MCCTTTQAPPRQCQRPLCTQWGSRCILREPFPPSPSQIPPHLGEVLATHRPRLRTQPTACVPASGLAKLVGRDVGSFFETHSLDRVDPARSGPFRLRLSCGHCCGCRGFGGWNVRGSSLLAAGGAGHTHPLFSWESQDADEPERWPATQLAGVSPSTLPSAVLHRAGARSLLLPLILSPFSLLVRVLT